MGKSNFSAILPRIPSTAPTPAISRLDTAVKRMDDRYFDYISAMAVAKRMLKTGIITTDDYTILEQTFSRKYSIPSNSIYRELDLISTKKRAIMSHHMEVVK